MSRRLYEVLQRFSPRVEPYSIDEMFLDLDGLGVDLVDHGRDIRAAILRKRRSRPASALATRKRKPSWPTSSPRSGRSSAASAICATRMPAQRLYPTIPLDEVWGIGAASAKKLQALGLQTVADLAAFDVKQGREVLTVTGARVIMELQGDVLPAAVAALAATQGPGRHPDIRGVRDGVGRAEGKRFRPSPAGQGRSCASMACSPAR